MGTWLGPHVGGRTCLAPRRIAAAAASLASELLFSSCLVQLAAPGFVVRWRSSPFCAAVAPLFCAHPLLACVRPPTTRLPPVPPRACLCGAAAAVLRALLLPVIGVALACGLMWRRNRWPVVAGRRGANPLINGDVWRITDEIYWGSVDAMGAATHRGAGSW